MLVNIMIQVGIHNVSLYKRVAHIVDDVFYIVPALDTDLNRHNRSITLTTLTLYSELEKRVVTDIIRMYRILYIVYIQTYNTGMLECLQNE